MLLYMHPSLKTVHHSLVARLLTIRMNLSNNLMLSWQIDMRYVLMTCWKRFILAISLKGTDYVDMIISYVYVKNNISILIWGH